MARCVWCGSANASDSRFCMNCRKPMGSAPVPGKCARCGNINAIDVERCTVCRTPLPEFQQASVPFDMVPSSGWVMDDTMQQRHHAFLDSARWRREIAVTLMTARPSGKLTLAAAFLIIAGLLTLFQAAIIFSMDPTSIDGGLTYEWILPCCGTLDVLFGLGALAGGFLAFRPSNYGLVLTGCLCAIAGFGLIAGTALGIVALVLVTSQRSEFRQ